MSDDVVQRAAEMASRLRMMANDRRVNTVGYFTPAELHDLADLIVDPLAAAGLLADPTTTVNAVRLQMALALHEAVHGDVWARPESPADVWRDLLETVKHRRLADPATSLTPEQAAVIEAAMAFKVAKGGAYWAGNAEYKALLAAVDRLAATEEET